MRPDPVYIILDGDDNFKDKGSNDPDYIVNELVRFLEYGPDETWIRH